MARSLAALAVLILAACASPARTVADTAEIRGTVTYRPRIALPPDAVVTVRLLDVSRADAPSETLAEATIPTDGRQVPIPFALRYDATRVMPANRYVVRAEIREANGALRWTTTTAYPVLTHGAGAGPVEIVVEAVEPTADAAPAPGRTFVYVCPGDERVAFTLRAGAGEAAVWLPARFASRYAVLPQVPAASGVRYEGDGLVVWTRADEATLEVDGVRLDGCTFDPAASVWEHARRSGVTFRAIGQEPGWTLEIGAGGRMRFATASGTPAEYQPSQVDLDLDGPRTVYRATGATGTLLVTVGPERCTDTMSGEAFEATVTVELGDQVFQGCGRAL